MHRKKQFIAGAICPQCSQMDSLVLFADDQSITCVDCGYLKSSQQRDSIASTQSRDVEQKTRTRKTYKNIGDISIKNLDH